MRRKIAGILLALMTTELTSCGVKEAVNETAAAGSSIPIAEENGLIVEDAFPIIHKTDKTVEANEPLTKVYGDFVIYNEAQGEKVDIPLKDFYFLEGEYLLTSDVPVYYTGGKTAGYAKEGSTIKVLDGNAEWLRFKNTEKKDYFTVDFLLVRVNELRNATSIEVVTTKPELFVVETESEILASVETQVTDPVQENLPEAEVSEIEKPKTEKSETEKMETEIPKTEVPATGESTINESAVKEPASEPELAANTKYTPEEAIAVYRAIIESNGISWNPMLKNGGSWGTGWIYLDKGYPEWAGNSAVESYKMGDGDGVPWDKYYLEVTGSDENCVYYTGWHD